MICYLRNALLVIVLGYNNQFIIGNIGDSRAYRFSEDKAEQITTDNSFVQDYLHEHSQSNELKSIENYSHILTRSISANDDPVDIYDNSGFLFTLRDNEIILLCSDGLIIDKINDLSFEIDSILKTSSSAEIAIERLFEWAMNAGSQDNISIVIGFSGKWIGHEDDKVVQTPIWRKPAFLATIALIIVILSIYLFRYSSQISQHKPSELTERPAVNPSISFNEWSMGEIESTIHLSNKVFWSFTVENDSILYYQLFHREVSRSRVDSTRIASNQRSITIGDVGLQEPKREYELWISAYTASGLVATSDKVIRKLEG